MLLWLRKVRALSFWLERNKIFRAVRIFGMGKVLIRDLVSLLLMDIRLICLIKAYLCIHNTIKG